MLRSLVGSEMCIRDRSKAWWMKIPTTMASPSHADKKKDACSPSPKLSNVHSWGDALGSSSICASVAAGFQMRLHADPGAPHRASHGNSLNRSRQTRPLVHSASGVSTMKEITRCGIGTTSIPMEMVIQRRCKSKSLFTTI
eukprot:TRINITY_DN10664_c0_g1_i1.p2 TRINITY_DN10664_c0_g1~~TRINITY_DN10664_c0_g1_i1.p2  ORF type:complete len:155 (-),score=27.58 TRINITY_DN10664_c0_g1_i1:39-461(-)